MFKSFGFRPKPKYEAANPVAQSRRSWQPGVGKRFPYAAFLGLLGAVLCAVAAAVVLMVSNGQSISRWKINQTNVQPTVLLAIFSALANACLRFAFSEGHVIAWWREALRGSSISNLHSHWVYGQGFFGGIFARPNINVVALSSFFITIVLIDGPLLQRASTIGTIDRGETVRLSVPVSPGPFVKGATGVFAPHDHAYWPTNYNDDFADVTRQYDNKSDIVIPNFGCEGTCTTTIQAAGFDVNCTESEAPYWVASLDDYLWCQTRNFTSPTGNCSLSDEVFRVDVEYSPWGDNIPGQHINFRTRFKDSSGRAGNLKQRNCTLREAVVEYPLRAVNDTVSLETSTNDSSNHTKFLLIRDSETSGMGSWPSTCGGIWRALHDKYTATANLSIAPPFYAVRTNDSTSRQYLTGNHQDNSTWRDPMPDMLAMARELALRAAIIATAKDPYYGPQYRTAAYLDIRVPSSMNTTNRTLSQSANATRHYSEVIYQSHYGFLGGALSIMLLATLAVLALLNGWWLLGRNATLSPFELARAFDAPMLANADSNATADDLVRHFGTEQIQYGVSQSASGTLAGKEADADSANVKTQPLVDAHELEHPRPLEATQTHYSNSHAMEDLDGGEGELRQRLTGARLHFQTSHQLSMPKRGDAF